MSGIEAIQQAFDHARSRGRAALMPYFTLGYPSQDESLSVVEELARSGADILELGVPFSDPLADGPTIQNSTYQALHQGMSVGCCLEMVRILRQRGTSLPLLLMGYVNPLLSYGVREFIHQATEAGADGLIVPDLPVEEAGEVEDYCEADGLSLVYLLSPSTGDERIELLARHSTGFLYLVSVNGVTGARQRLPLNLPNFIGRVRQHTRLPLAVGFGISTPAQAAQVGKISDGVIVGSALIESVKDSQQPARAAGNYITSLLRAMKASCLSGG